MWWWIGAALAGPQYAGVPVEGVEGFGRAMFQSAQTGWHVLVEDGMVRVYVAPDEDTAHAWVEKMCERLAKLDPQPYTPPPPEAAAAAVIAPEEAEDAVVLPPLVFDEAFGDPGGDGLLIFRDGNLGVVVHTKANAMQWAQRTQAAAVLEPTPWPLAPTLRQDELGWWALEAPDAVHISYVGGERIPDAGLRFYAPPRKGVAWGPLGRAAVIEFDAAGQPKPAATATD